MPESITVASEAVALGVPSLLQIDKDYAYVAEQERAELIRRFSPSDDIDQVLGETLDFDHSDFRTRAREFAFASGDVNDYVTKAVMRVGAIS